MTSYNIKVKHPNGTFKLNIPSDGTMRDVAMMIESKADTNSNLRHDALEIKKGHPPTALGRYSLDMPSSDILGNGDLIHVRVAPPGSSQANAIAIDDDDEQQQTVLDDRRKRSKKKQKGNERSSKRFKQQQENQSPASIEHNIILFATEQDLKTRQSSPNQSYLRHIMTLREVLGLDSTPHSSEPALASIVPMEFIIVANFMIDFDSFWQDCQEIQVMCPTKIFFYNQGLPMGQVDGAEYHTLNPRDEPSKPGKPTSNPTKYKFFGCHHTKLFLVGFADRLRVIVHTANLIGCDLYSESTNANGAFVQDFPLKEETAKSEASRDGANEEDIPDFESSLVSYMKTYGYEKSRNWTRSQKTQNDPPLTLARQLSLYDFSEAKGVLIPSCPGYYNLDGDKCHLQGYMKVKTAIEKHVRSDVAAATAAKAKSKARYGPVVCQFSSTGALSEKWMKEFIWSLSVPAVKDGQNLGELRHATKLVYPTVNCIENSVFPPGGGAVPGRLKNLEKSFLRPLFHKWSSTNISYPIHKGRNIPHIKTFFQLKNNDGDESTEEFAWFLIGSHNLSKPAWGEVQNSKYGETLKVSSWELGVFVSPVTTKKKLVPVDAFPVQKDTVPIPLPYPVNPQPYGPKDIPWHVE